jgi:hypothetical protein
MCSSRFVRLAFRLDSGLRVALAEAWWPLCRRVNFSSESRFVGRGMPVMICRGIG